MNPYILLAVVVSLLGSYVGGYQRGAHIEAKSDQVAALTKTTSQLRADLIAAQNGLDAQKAFAENALKASSDAAAQEGKTNAQISTLIAERDHYVRQITAQGGKCALTLSDVRSLRRIGGPITGPKPVRASAP